MVHHLLLIVAPSVFSWGVTLTKCWLGRWFHQRELLGIDGAGSWDPNLCHLQMELSASRAVHSLYSTHFHSEVVVAGCWGLCIWHSCFKVDRQFFHIPVHVLQLVTWYVPITKSLPLLLGFSCLVLSGAEVKRQVSVPRVDSAKKGSGEQRQGRRAFHCRETTISWEQRAKSISPKILPINITWTKTYHFYF